MNIKRTALLATLAFAASPIAIASNDFFDGDFTSDWSYSTVTAGNGGSASISVSGPDGNPGSYAVASTSVNANCGAVYAFAFKTTATYDPAAAALSNLNYSEDAKLINGFGSGQATGPAISQGGHLYVLPGFPTGTDPNWHHMVASGLTASSFIEVLGGPCPNYTNPGSHPDFSTSGAVMTFGYFRANSQIDPFGSYSITAAIDNWSISLGPIIYAALGDSYSSGEGVQPFFSDSDNGINACHRSLNAYGFRVNFPGVHLNSAEFLACSGAVTSDITSTSPELSHDTEPAQLQKHYPPPRDSTLIVNDETDMVTLSVGGDDLGFVWILNKCGRNWVGPECSSDSFHPVHGSSMSLKQMIANAIPVVGGRVSSTYAAIKGQAPTASVFVLGYPRLFDGNHCGITLDLAFSSNERQYLDSVSDSLNLQIASSASASGVHFVGVAPTFLGHGVCNAARWINGLDGPEYSHFHPTSMGQHAYAAALNRYMKNWVAKGGPVQNTGIPANPLALLAASPAPSSEAPDDLTPSVGNLFVKASGFVPCSGPQVAFVPGQSIEVSGGGYGAGQTVTLRLEGPAYLSAFATPSADASGRLDAVVTLPGDAPTSGEAELTAEGTGAGGEVRQLEAMIPMSTSFVTDTDFDEIPDPCDNCPTVSIYSTTDTDGDGLGDACDPCPTDFANDVDGDGLCANVDPCPLDAANDADGDGVCAPDDNCPAIANASQFDTDGDLFGDACDGAPANAGVWAAPGEVTGFVFASKTTMSWDSLSDAAGPLTLYDVARGSIADIPFELAAPCIATGISDPTAVDTGVPTPAQGFFYLVHARNAIGFGTYGFASSGEERNVFGCP